MTHTPAISAIVAMAENRVIGKDNKLPWHLPADLQHFKAITSGNPILMGRKTFESIGRPLPNRTNIIISRDHNYQAQGCIVTTSIAAAIQQAKTTACQEIFIIGGAEIYRQALTHLQFIYLTVLHQLVEGDTYFPEMPAQEWQEVAREDHQANAENAYNYSFIKLARISR